MQLRYGVSQILLFSLNLPIKAAETAALLFIKHLCQSTTIGLLSHQNALDFHTKHDRAFPPHSAILAGCYNHLEIALIWLCYVSELRQEILLGVLLGVFGIVCSPVWLLLAWSHHSDNTVMGRNLEWNVGAGWCTERALVRASSVLLYTLCAVFA